MFARFGDRADFVNIYIKEAHPSDGWAFGGNGKGNRWSVPQATSESERIAQCKEWMQAVGAKSAYYVDPMDDNMRLHFQALPERLYILEPWKKQVVCVYQGGPGPHEYNMGEIERWLETRFAEEAAVET